ncbi:MAG: PepSY-associated TM helix domain-containing protein [Acidobacteriota bacterium]
MSRPLRRSMAELHTWTGLLLGWLMFAMFTTGTAAYFQHEITRWMEPEIVGRAPNQTVAAERAVSYLQRTAPGAASWTIALPDDRRVRTEVRWQPVEEGAPRETRILDGHGRGAEVRDTRGGYFLYRFHFDLHYLPVLWARYLVGIAAMSMLVALVSGIITHKKIFARFFTLSLGKGLRSWYDAHNITSVFALPFFLMITYTGLVTLANQYMPIGGLANYSDMGAYFAELFPRPQTSEAEGEAAEPAPIGGILQRARGLWNGAEVETITIQHPGDAGARVDVRRSRASTVGTRAPTLSFDGVTGEPLAAAARGGGAYAAESVLVGIHAGRFASVGLRWMYVLSGLFGVAMVGTGLVQWTARRRTRLPDPGRPNFGFWLVERLNIGAIAGLGAGLAAYFLANRLLPQGLPARAEWEVHCLFIVWGLSTLWALLRPAARAWPETLSAAALLYAAVPVVNGLSTPRGLVPSLAAGDWVFVSFDLVMVLLAAVYAGAARVAARKAAPSPRTAPADIAGLATGTGG